jgi:hypothetical protein
MERVVLFFFPFPFPIPTIIPFWAPFLAADADEARARNVKEENADFILICRAQRKDEGQRGV